MTADTEMGRHGDAENLRDSPSPRLHVTQDAGVAQWQEALVLGTRQCGFESLRRYQIQIHAVVAQLADAHG